MSLAIQLPDQFVEIKGIRTRYWKAGAGTRAVVLIHGFSASVLEWTANLKALAEGNTVYAFDLPGHGRTDKPAMEYDYDFFADFTHGFLAAMGIGRAVLVGHSLGANISLYFAARHPEMVEKLILVGPGYGRRLNAFFHLASLPWVGEYLLKPPPSTRTVQDAIRLVTYRPVDYGPEIIDSYFEFQHSPGYSRALLNFLRGAMRPVGFTPKGEGYFRYLDNRIPELAQPVLVVWGKQDRVVPFSNAAHLKGLLANGEFWDLDECGHCPNYEYPDEFNRRVVSFLERAS